MNETKMQYDNAERNHGNADTEAVQLAKLLQLANQEPEKFQGKLNEYLAKHPKKDCHCPPDPCTRITNAVLSVDRDGYFQINLTYTASWSGTVRLQRLYQGVWEMIEQYVTDGCENVPTDFEWVFNSMTATFLDGDQFRVLVEYVCCDDENEPGTQAGTIISNIYTYESGGYLSPFESGVIAHWSLDRSNFPARDAVAAHWKFDASPLVSEVGNYPMTYAGDPPPSLLPGKFGGTGMELSDASNAYGYGPVPGDTFTNGCWVKLTQMPESDVWIAGTAYLAIKLTVSGGNPRFVAEIEGEYDAAVVLSSVTVALGQWYYVLVWYDGISVYISVNDENPRHGPFAYPIYRTQDNCTFGDGSGGSEFHGVIDEFTAWNRVLTPMERTAMLTEQWDATNGAKWESDVGDYPLTPTGAVPACTGRIGNGAEVSGTRYLTAASPFNLSADRTIGFWVFYDLSPSLSAGSGTIIGNWGGNGGENGWYIGAVSDRSCAFCVSYYDTENEYVTSDFIHSTVTLQTGAWNYVVACYEASSKTIGISVNAEPMVTVALPYAAGSTVRNMFLGDPDNEMFLGLVDELTVWDRVLSAEEIAALAAGLDFNGNPVEAPDASRQMLDYRLAHYWTMDGSGTFADAIAHNSRSPYSLVATGSVNLDSDNKILGPSSVHFEPLYGDFSRLEAPHDMPSFAADNAFTISFWAYMSNLNASGVICKWKPGGMSFGIVFDGSTLFGLVSPDGNTQSAVASSTEIVTDTWYHIVLRWDGSLLSLVVNDPYVYATMPFDGPVHWSSGAALFTIGYDQLADSQFDGYVDEVAIYSRCLSDEEVNGLYNGGAGYRGFITI